MKKPKQTPSSPKLTDADRYKRFLETAEKVGASDNPLDLERAIHRIVQKEPESHGDIDDDRQRMGKGNR